MTTYVDTSALIKRYVDEPESDRVDQLLAAEPQLVSSRVTVVELRRNLARLLDGAALAQARAAFSEDLEAFSLVEVDERTCDLAATIAEQSGVRSLDAIHLGSARRLGTAIGFLTFDHRQANVARSIGFRMVV